MSDVAPRVSVVIPVYNGAATIERTIASVYAQTFGDFELIVIDDGSTDDTAARVAASADARLKLHRYANAGLAESRNRGVARARGELIAFLDADDLWTSDKLEAQVAALAAAPRAALAYSLTDSIDAQDRFLARGSHIVENGQVYEKLVLRNVLDNGSTPLIRAATLRAAGPFDVTIPATADWDMWMRLALRDEIVCVPKVQVLYRVHDGAMSSNVRVLEEQMVTALRKGLAALPDGAARRALERAALANVYYYSTSRVLRAARTRADGRLAARYALQFLRIAPLSIGNLTYAAIQFAKSGLVILLPGVARTLLSRVGALRQRL